MIAEGQLIEALRTAIRDRLPRYGSKLRVQDVARECGVPHTYISMIASGKRSPLGLMLRVADYLKIPVEIRIGDVRLGGQ